MLENYLEGVVAKDICEETDMGYEKKLSEAKSQLSMLEQQYDNEGSLQRRLADFNMIYNKNSPTSSGSEMNCRFEHKCS